VLHSRIGPWPYPKTLDKAGKAFQGQTLIAYYKKYVNYGHKKFTGLASGRNNQELKDLLSGKDMAKNK
jgi:hypothetical protein